jgi:4a-hydroxytetrahydrobiopterin dehydratase
MTPPTTTKDYSDLLNRRCQPCQPGTPALDDNQIDALLPHVPGWEFRTDHIEKTYGFKNYHETLAFVNAIAWVAHREDHHPDLEVGYNKCKVKYSTHAVKGLSENDFICAAKVEALLAR